MSDEFYTIECSSETLKKENKAKLDDKLNEMAQAVCGLLNSHGGRVIFHTEDGCYSERDRDDLTRRIEQKLLSTFNIVITQDKVMDRPDSELHFRVEASQSSCQPYTLNYNLHYTSETEVRKVLSLTPKDGVIDIVQGTNRKRKLENYEFGNHWRKFSLGEKVPLRESKNTQLKKLKDEKSKKINLASRITNKSNKLVYYVSGFANGEGGHIYYGIKTSEDGSNVVEGQIVHDQNIIIREVDKAIGKMIWPNGPPQKGKHWDIFFEPVSGVDERECKFVIVISVAPFPKGVFAEEPESYKIVGGKLNKLDYTEWRQTLLQHQISRRSQVSGTLEQESVGRCSWSSSHAGEEYARTNRKFVQLRNDGDRSEFTNYAAQLQKSGSYNQRIISQQQEAGYLIREGKIKKAEELLIRDSKDATIFELTWLYWTIIAKRLQPGCLEQGESLFYDAMQKVQLIPHILTGPWLLVQKAIMVEARIGKGDESYNKELISQCKASYLEVLRQVADFDESPVVVTLKQRMHTGLARMHLGCFRCQDKTIRKLACTVADRKEARKMLGIVEEAHNNGWPMTQLCHCEHHLLRSELNIRNSYEFRDISNTYLKAAQSASMQALEVAKRLNFTRFLNHATEQLSYLDKQLKKGESYVDYVQLGDQEQS